MSLHKIIERSHRPLGQHGIAVEEQGVSAVHGTEGLVVCRRKTQIFPVCDDFHRGVLFPYCLKGSIGGVIIHYPDLEGHTIYSGED